MHYLFNNISIDQEQFQMKSTQKSDSRKKQRPVLSKVTSAGTLFKKQSIKKTSAQKKQDTSNPSIKKLSEPKSTQSQSANNSKGTLSSNSGAHSTKMIQQSLRTSPKSSLSEINTFNLKKSSMENRKVKLQKPITFAKKLPNPQYLQPSSKESHVSEKEVKEEVKKSLANVIKAYHYEKQSHLNISQIEQPIQLSNKKTITTVSTTTNNPQDKFTRSSFTFLNVIGEGGYGKVWKVEHNKTRMNLAMKQMSKALIILKKSVDNVNNQIKILSKIRSNWISNIICAFNDRDNLYLGMDYLSGGDLRTQLGQSEKLKQSEVKFLIACIVKGLEYVHSQKIFHRDIKPENLVIDEKGYLRLTDFGIARSVKDKQSLDASGTPGYMAPEVICKQVHSYSVDYYAVGIICYELMMGKRPYYGQNRAQVRDAILSKQHSIKKKQIPQGWPSEAADFVNKLIQRQPTSRLGSKNGIKQLMQHPWFSKYQWKQLEQRKIVSPFKPHYNVPTITDRLDEYQQAVNQYKLLQRTDEKIDIFAGYFYNFREQGSKTLPIKKQLVKSK